MLICSVPADQFIVSIHCGEECVYQSVLGGRGEREKVGKHIHIHISERTYISRHPPEKDTENQSQSTLPLVHLSYAGRPILLAVERRYRGRSLLCSLSKGVDCLQHSQGVAVDR